MPSTAGPARSLRKVLIERPRRLATPVLEYGQVHQVFPELPVAQQPFHDRLALLLWQCTERRPEHLCCRFCRTHAPSTVRPNRDLGQMHSSTPRCAHCTDGRGCAQAGGRSGGLPYSPPRIPTRSPDAGCSSSGRRAARLHGIRTPRPGAATVTCPRKPTETGLDSVGGGGDGARVSRFRDTSALLKVYGPARSSSPRTPPGHGSCGRRQGPATCP
jgi:hypothetical protein